LYSKTGGKKSKIKEPTTELKTNRPVLRELFEDIKQYKKLIKNYFSLQTDRFARFPEDFYQLIKI